jgi:cysteine synthase A
MYASTESEGKRRRHQVDTVVEGIGLNRITKNFSEALPFIDDAYSSVLTLASIDLTDDG